MAVESIFGYHGTTRDNADSILTSNTFIDSVKDNEWLGRGVYFFYYLGHARWWISHDRFKGIRTAIIKATLSYDTECLLDLDDPDTLRVFNRVCKELISSMQTKKVDFPAFGDLDPHKRSCLACNMYRQLNPNIGIIIHTFSVDSNNKASVFQQVQRQICVLDHSIIKGVEEVV